MKGWRKLAVGDRVRHSVTGLQGKIAMLECELSNYARKDLVLVKLDNPEPAGGVFYSYPENLGPATVMVAR